MKKRRRKKNVEDEGGNLSRNRRKDNRVAFHSESRDGMDGATMTLRYITSNVSPGTGNPDAAGQSDEEACETVDSDVCGPMRTEFLVSGIPWCEEERTRTPNRVPSSERSRKRRRKRSDNLLKAARSKKSSAISYECGTVCAWERDDHHNCGVRSCPRSNGRDGVSRYVTSRVSPGTTDLDPLTESEIRSAKKTRLPKTGSPTTTRCVPHSEGSPHPSPCAEGRAVSSFTTNSHDRDAESNLIKRTHKCIVTVSQFEHRYRVPVNVFDS